jgi:NADH:ubiquinone oxidoreductase subunit 5 (subunit L)/multisubunit Na+/H+ antiporter MnhA subunit
MVLPIIILIVVPVLLGIVYVSPFDQPEETDVEEVSETNVEEISETNASILYFILMGIWTVFLLRVLLRIKKGTFKILHKY